MTQFFYFKIFKNCFDTFSYLKNTNIKKNSKTLVKTSFLLKWPNSPLSSCLRLTANKENNRQRVLRTTGDTFRSSSIRVTRSFPRTLDTLKPFLFFFSGCQNAPRGFNLLPDTSKNVRSRFPFYIPRNDFRLPKLRTPLFCFDR